MGRARQRHLQPGFLLVVGERLWVVDRLQPAAVVLDTSTGAVVATVGWSAVPPAGSATTGSRMRSWRVCPGPDGIWVQQPPGPVVLVTEDGLRSGHLSGGSTLTVASSHGAWCLPAPPRQDVAGSEHAPAAPDRGGRGPLVLVHPDRTSTVVHLDSPVAGAREHDGDVYLQVETGGGSRRNRGADAWDLEPDLAWVRVAATETVPDRLGPTGRRSEPPPPLLQPADLNGGERLGSRWAPSGAGQSTAEPDRGVREDAELAGLRWYAGWDRSRRALPREVVAGARDVETGQERFRVGLGPGAVTAMRVHGAGAWIAVEGPRRTATYSRPTPTALYRVDGAAGAVDCVLAADAVDIAEHCWPLPDEPVDVADYTAFWRGRLSGLDRYWTDQRGAQHPLASGLADSRVDVVGRWPDTSLHVTFTHPGRPGQRLRRVIPLFDELGRQVPPEYAEIHLMEDLDTGKIPATTTATDGYLDL